MESCIQFFIQETLKYSKYFDAFIQIIHSLKVERLIGQVKDQILTTPDIKFSTYENSAYRIAFNYRNYWTLSDQRYLDSPIDSHLSFTSPGELFIVYMHLDLPGEPTLLKREKNHFSTYLQGIIKLTLH